MTDTLIFLEAGCHERLCSISEAVSSLVWLTTAPSGCAGYMRHPFTESRFDNDSRALQRPFFERRADVARTGVVPACSWIYIFGSSWPFGISGTAVPR